MTVVTSRDIWKIVTVRGVTRDTPYRGVSRVTSQGTASTKAVTTAQIGGELVDLAERLRRLAPSVRDPERFHVEKSDIEAGLRRLAHKIR